MAALLSFGPQNSIASESNLSRIQNAIAGAAHISPDGSEIRSVTSPLNIELNNGLTNGLPPASSPPPDQLSNHRPFPAAQTSPETVSAAAKQSPSLPHVYLSALHTLMEIPIARPSEPLRQTSPSSSVTLPAVPAANPSTQSHVVPPVSSGQIGFVSDRNNSTLGNTSALPSEANRTGAPHAVVPSLAPVSHTDLGTNNNGPGAESGQSPRKENTPVAGESVSLPAAAPQIAPAIASPTVQVTAGAPTNVLATADRSCPSEASLGPPSYLPNATEIPVHGGTGPVHMAQMANQAAQSEMRIGMNTSAFGNVEVRTVVHANEVGILIGSEKGDLRSLLSNELPGIAHTLQQQDIRLNHVNFHQQGFAFSNQMSSGSDSQPRPFSSKPSPARQNDPLPVPSEDLAERPEREGSRNLSILA